MVEIGVVLEPEAVPEGRTGDEGRPPILTDVRGFYQVPLVGAIFENPGQGLWWESVDRNRRVPNRPNRLQNLREITFNAIDLWTVGRLAICHVRIPGDQTFCGCKPKSFLENEVSKGDGLTLGVRLPSEWRIWIQDLNQCAHELLDAELAARI